MSVTEIWNKAQEIAEQEYNEEFGEDAWLNADKYEREDYVFNVYFRMKDEDRKMERDSKGRFVSTKNVNNTVKENRTMTKRDERMETLKANGVDTTGFFDLNMRLPLGSKVEVIVNGQTVKMADFTSNEVIEKELVAVVKNDSVAPLSNEYIEQLKAGIEDNGYVKNTRLWRRFVTAQTFRMLNYKSYDGKRSGFDAALSRFDYKYQFKMTSEELHVQTELWKSGATDEYEERNLFFNKDVVAALCEQYIRQLKKYIKNQKERYFRGQRYAKLNKYGNVLHKDLQDKVYAPMEYDIRAIKFARNPKELEEAFSDFHRLYNKLPYGTPKCPEWKCAYKASGSFYCLKNLIMFHGIVLDGCTGIQDSLIMLNYKAEQYKGDEGWRLHEYMKKVIEDNNFDLAESIEAHK